MVLEGACSELVSPLFRMLEDPASGIDERGEGRIVDEQLVLLPDGGPEPLGRSGAV